MEADRGDVSVEEDVVHVEGLSLGISGRVLIEELDFRIAQGARVGLTGPSGCGKTTLLRSVVARQLGSGSFAKSFRVANSRIGYVPQEGGTLPWYSVQKNLRIFGGEMEGKEDGWSEEVLAMVELEEAARMYPGDLSGGEGQRMRLGCSIAVRPQLVCADEPLTEVGLEQKWRLLRRWSEEMVRRRTSLLLVSHDIDTLLYLCDEVVVLGSRGQTPAIPKARFQVEGTGHPRAIDTVGSEDLRDIRKEMVEALYLGQANAEAEPEASGESGEGQGDDGDDASAI